MLPLAIQQVRGCRGLWRVLLRAGRSAMGVVLDVPCSGLASGEAVLGVRRWDWLVDRVCLGGHEHVVARGAVYGG